MSDQHSNAADSAPKADSRIDSARESEALARPEHLKAKSGKHSKSIKIPKSEHDALIKDREEYQKLRDEWMRLHAEFDNYKKRMIKEKNDFMKFALENVMTDLLAVLDNFERANQAMDQNQDLNAVKDGVRMVYRQLVEALGKKGLERIEAKGKIFDPEFHEAIGIVETDEHPDHTVLTEIQNGYMFQGRLLRPALVRIARPKEEASSPTESEPQSLGEEIKNND